MFLIKKNLSPPQKKTFWKKRRKNASSFYQIKASQVILFFFHRYTLLGWHKYPKNHNKIKKWSVSGHFWIIIIIIIIKKNETGTCAIQRASKLTTRSTLALSLERSALKGQSENNGFLSFPFALLCWLFLLCFIGQHAYKKKRFYVGGNTSISVRGVKILAPKDVGPFAALVQHERRLTYTLKIMSNFECQSEIARSICHIGWPLPLWTNRKATWMQLNNKIWK